MKKSKWKRRIMACCCAILTFCAILSVLWLLSRNQVRDSELELADGWTVAVNGKVQEPQMPMQDYRFEKLQIDDRVVLTNRLPEKLDRHQTMTFLLYLSAIDVKLDDEVIYSYGSEYAEKNWLVGSGYHFIDLPDDAAGKEIEISINVREPNAFTSLSTPKIASTKTAYQIFAKGNLIGTGVCMFLSILGAVLLIVSSVAVCYTRAFVRLVYIGAFSFLMGIWSLCNMKILQIFHVDLASNTTTEYLTLYVAPIAFILLLAEIRRESALWRRQVAYGVAALLTLFAAVTTALQFSNIEHYPRFLGYFHLFGAISLFLAGVTSIDKKHKVDKSSMTLYIGIMLLSLSVVLDLIRFNLQKYFLQEYEWLTYSVIPIGALIFIVLLLISYIFYVYNILVEKAEKDWLIERAYHDELCGIYNRNKCNEVFNKLNDNERDYALVNLDLNGLKIVNDTYGHAQGDLLLKEFAGILQISFKDIGEVYRMGGDEFLVVIKEEQFPQIDQCLARMVKLEKRRSSELPFVIDSSYGVAKRSECPGEKTEKVYTLADQRMYEMKTKKKINRRLRK